MVDNFKHIVGGQDYPINEHIVIHNPTLGEIRDYGEEKYLEDVYYATLRPYDAAVFLDDMKRDYRYVEDFELFYTLCKHLINSDSLIFSGLDISNMTVGVNPNTNEYYLYSDQVVIDKLLYTKIVQAIRSINFVSDKIFINPGSTYAVQVWIRQQRDKMKRAARKPKEPADPYSSIVSALVNTSGFKYDYTSVMDLHISQFFDAFYRINKIQDAQNIMTGIYSGCIDSKKLNKDVLDWTSRININKQTVDDSKMVEIPSK